MYPHAKEMPSFVETVSYAQEQAPPYPGPYINVQQVPSPVPQQMIVVQSGSKCEYVCVLKFLSTVGSLDHIKWRYFFLGFDLIIIIIWKKKQK